MKIAYQCFASGEYLGPLEVYDGFLPNGATWETPPAAKEGHALFFKDGKWKQVEDHRGQEGYVDGQRTTIREVGPLPKGWSTEPPAPTPEELWQSLRHQRDSRLATCDWTVLPDAQLTPDEVADWKAYRQDLRDLPAQAGAPWTAETIPWPAAPGKSE